MRLTMQTIEPHIYSGNDDILATQIAYHTSVINEHNVKSTKYTDFRVCLTSCQQNQHEFFSFYPKWNTPPSGVTSPAPSFFLIYFPLSTAVTRRPARAPPATIPTLNQKSTYLLLASSQWHQEIEEDHRDGTFFTIRHNRRTCENYKKYLS